MQVQQTPTAPTRHFWRSRLFRGTSFALLDPVLLAILLPVILAAPRSVRDAGWVDHLEGLTPLAIGGLLVGYLLARTRVPSAFAHLLGVTLGIEAVAVVYAARVDGADLQARVDALGARLATWGEAAFGGGATNDPLLFAVAMGALAWLLGYASAWLLFRGEAPWLAVTSNAIALLMNLSYAPASLGNGVPAFAFWALLLVAVHQVARRRALWSRANLRVEHRLVARLIGGSAALALAALSIAWILPPGGTHPAATTVWDRLSAPWQSFERDFDRLFASLQPAERTARGLNFGRTLAPRGSFELGDTPVLQVQSALPRYWRATTADRYTGQAITSSETVSYGAEENALLLPDEQRPAARIEETVRVKILANRSSVAFAPEAPVRVSLPVEVEVRGTAADLGSVRLITPLTRDQEYTVVSAVTNATVPQLRAAGQDYPEWVRQRHLQLPRRAVPVRVAELAAEVVRGATTPYDRAVAIEEHLRNNFTYSTQVPVVPADRDWADYLLFDSRIGYCDYFATTMVVMLRTLGLPARVASGFAPGDFDQATGTWTIREHHAHTWVEMYFPRYGWITFEPSAIRPIPSRLETVELPPLPTPATLANTGVAAGLPPDEQDELARLGRSSAAAGRPALPPTWAIVTLGSLGVVALLFGGSALFLTVLWRQRLRGLAWYQRPYASAIQLAGWFRVVRARRSDTPYEAADALAREVPSAEPALRSLADAYVEGTYAGRPPEHNPRSTWRQSRRLLALTLARRRVQAWRQQSGLRHGS